MIAVSALRKYILSEAPGCPTALVDRAIVKSARDLCDRARCWKSAQETAGITATDPDLTIVIPACANLVAIQYLAFRGQELVQTTERELSAWDCDWRTTTGDPTHYFTTLDTTLVRLYPTPNRTLAGSITYEVYLKPKLDEPELESYLVDQFLDPIQHGALYELLRMNGRPWSNPQLADHYRRRYQEGVYSARDKALRMYASENLNILPEPMF